MCSFASVSPHFFSFFLIAKTFFITNANEINARRVYDQQMIFPTLQSLTRTAKDSPFIILRLLIYRSVCAGLKLRKESI